MEASDDAAVDEVPGEECSARMVVRWAIQELSSWLVDGNSRNGFFELSD